MNVLNFFEGIAILNKCGAWKVCGLDSRVVVYCDLISMSTKDIDWLEYYGWKMVMVGVGFITVEWTFYTSYPAAYKDQ